MILTISDALQPSRLVTLFRIATLKVTFVEILIFTLRKISNPTQSPEKLNENC